MFALPFGRANIYIIITDIKFIQLFKKYLLQTKRNPYVPRHLFIPKMTWRHLNVIVLMLRFEGSVFQARGSQMCQDIHLDPKWIGVN